MATDKLFTRLNSRSPPVEPKGAGTLFGLAIAPTNAAVYFVDHGINTLNLLH